MNAGRAVGLSDGAERAGERSAPGPLQSRVSIRTALVLMAVIMMLPLLAMVGFVIYRGAQEAGALARMAVVDAAHTRAQAIENQLRQLGDYLGAIAERPLVRALDPARCDPLLEQLRDLDRRLASVGLRTRAGNSLCLRSPAARAGVVDPGDAPWLREALGADGFHVGNAFFGKITQDWVVALSAPVRDDSGRRTGAVVITVSLQVFEPLMVSGGAVEGAVLALVDRSGTVLYRSLDNARWRGRKAFDDRMPQIERTRAAEGLDGVERIYASADIPAAGWRVLAGQPAAVVSGSVRRQILESVLVWGLLAVLACALALAAARSIGSRIERLRVLVRAAGGGHTEVPIPAGGPAEIAELAQEFNRMLAARRRSEEELRGMAQRLVTLQDKERRDIARELHDRVGQNLAALSINLARLAGGRGAGAERRAHIAECASLVEQTGLIVQDVLTELKPPMLANYGLLDALRFHARDFSRRTGIEVAVAEGDDGARLPLDVEMALFRIAQAALNNTAQHARAKGVRVLLERAKGRVKFEVRDDGVGFDVERALASGRLGLTAMRERAEAIGGSLRIESSAESGARIIVEVENA